MWFFLYYVGVRIVFNGYKDRFIGEWSVDIECWNNILDLVKKGMDVFGVVVD